MRRSLRAIMLITTILVMNNTIYSAPLSKEINSGWKLRQGRLENWYPATVPGTVHTDLLANGKIDDPFFRLNERGLQWIDKEDWVYETSFDVAAGIMAMENIRLRFSGLDTYADVYLNDKKILSADNMFREWIVDIKNIVKEKDNILKVYLHSPLKIDVPKWDNLPYKYEAANDQSENGGVFDKKVSVFARKAGYHYGWDWGPRLVTSGIWRPVVLEAWNDARIENIQIIQNNVSAKSATISCVAEVLADKSLKGVIMTVSDVNNGVVYGRTKCDLSVGKNSVKVDFIIKNPKLWWSNGLGKPNMYTFSTDMSVEDREIDSRTDKTGIRSIELVREKDSLGESFYFRLNGVNVFAKGANYIPCDVFLPRVTKDIYRKTIEDAAAVNMNMLRVWGGGVYEDDYFYELCDEMGIMVWQDFMFACSLYPAEAALLENIRQEAIDNVKRLRNHPCIAVWCGSNENVVAWYNWGWKKKYYNQNPEWANTIWTQFKNLYFETLPDVVKDYGSGVAYTPSSPFFSKDAGESPTAGDRHYWGVWHAEEPIANYNIAKSRFFSEYGFQSFPSFGSVKRYAPLPEDWDIRSDVMMAHQRGGVNANNRIENYLLKEYRKPLDFERFLYINQVLQGDAVKTAMEAHRRDMPYCMGTLFWQHNDCWPVASWASRDYYGTWKAQHYFTANAYRDVLVSPIEQDGLLKVYVISDRLKPFKATLNISLVKLEGGVIYTVSKNVVITPNSSLMLHQETLAGLLKGLDRGDVVVRAEIQPVGKSERFINNYFFGRQKDVNYPKVILHDEIKVIPDGFEVAVSSEKFARAVYLSVDNAPDLHFCDNFFDIMPQQSVSVTVKSSMSLEEFKSRFKMLSLSAAY